MSANTERDNLASVIIEYLPGADGPADSRTITDAILAEFMPEHDRKVAGRAWDEGHAVGGAEMRMLLLDPPLKPIPNPYSRRES